MRKYGFHARTGMATSPCAATLRPRQPLFQPETSMNSSPASARAVLVLGANGRFGLAAAGVRRRRLACPRPCLPGCRRRHAGERRARARTAASADALHGRPAPDVVVHGINPIYTRRDEAPLAARAGMDPPSASARSSCCSGNVGNYGEAMPPGSTRRRAAADDRRRGIRARGTRARTPRRRRAVAFDRARR